MEVIYLLVFKIFAPLASSEYIFSVPLKKRNPFIWHLLVPQSLSCHGDQLLLSTKFQPVDILLWVCIIHFSQSVSISFSQELRSGPIFVATIYLFIYREGEREREKERKDHKFPRIGTLF